MQSGKVNQSKIALKEDGAIQFEPTKNANTFKDVYSKLAGDLVGKLPVAPNKFKNKAVLHEYREKQTTITMNYVIATLEAKKILSSLDTSKTPSLDGRSSKFLEDGAEVLASPLCKL